MGASEVLAGTIVGTVAPHRAAGGQGGQAVLLVCTGDDDPFVPVAQVNALAAEMTKAQADWQIMSYGGTVHSFTNPDADRVAVPGIPYNRLADERSWNAMATFFEEIFGRA
jgi:dienelactone hydrolase